jgi:hypothetical protein
MAQIPPVRQEVPYLSEAVSPECKATRVYHADICLPREDFGKSSLECSVISCMYLYNHLLNGKVFCASVSTMYE